ncbi:ATP-dependent RNA helicase, putative [Plasmodium ovale wallikeri]|uniref:RNA helicase n=2 Tax=Plasmodium ovale TaxID=36330 RepID=A0A1A9A0B2_PLAOA|nr:ATP-dependent RNA helicase, putative [Plasmodium ovale wallikeri]SBT49582.1 ATP-dependent RNA helicase, putative [Plasmodium ovale wallikeri]SBT82602.1 DNA helicase 60, putative [Plasmodium ovale]
MRHILKFKHINCRGNEHPSLLKNLLHINKESFKFISTRNKVGNNVIRNDECGMRSTRRLNKETNRKIYTESKIKEEISEVNTGKDANRTFSGSLDGSLRDDVGIEELEDAQLNYDNAHVREVEDNLRNDYVQNEFSMGSNNDSRKLGNMENSDLEHNMQHDDPQNDFDTYDRFNRYERQNEEVGENGFINYKNKMHNKFERGKNRSKNFSEQYRDRDNQNDVYNQNGNEGQTNRYSRNLNDTDRYSKLGDSLKDIEWNKVKVKIERENLLSNNDSKLKKLSSEELQNELKKNNIYVSNNLMLNNIITKFSDLDFHESILNYLSSKFKEPTAIQKITWPIALSGKDLIGVAETGSGKTLAFVLPCLMHILKQKQKQKEADQMNGTSTKEKMDLENGQMEDVLSGAPLGELANQMTGELEGDAIGKSQYAKQNFSERIQEGDNLNDHEERNTYGLILLPTRELCMQVLDEIKVFEKPLNLKSVAVYGGVPKYFQINNLKKGVDIIVATPGRLLDYLENGIINLLRCIYVVIDEADRLLDMGFEKQLRKIMTQINKNKQLLFLTATWPEQVRKLAYDFCSFDPIKIQIGKSELTANKNIEQNIIVSSSIDLKKKLLDWLKGNYENNKVLIFCDTKRNCDNLCKELRYHQYNALSIHGDKQQRERDRILNNYKSDRCNILVATDVASRGLDIKNISVVINYDIPNTIEDYIHRIGRTGRAGNRGKSILFFSYDYYVPQKFRFAKELIKLLNKTNQVVPKELKEIAGTR